MYHVVELMLYAEHHKDLLHIPAKYPTTCCKAQNFPWHIPDSCAHSKYQRLFEAVRPITIAAIRKPLILVIIIDRWSLVFRYTLLITIHLRNLTTCGGHVGCLVISNFDKARES